MICKKGLTCYFESGMIITIIKQGGEPLCKYLTQTMLYNLGKTGVVCCIDGSHLSIDTTI
ncbi:hypothetical protein TKO01_04190 [Tetragenococcus koreensis]|nr:hypothetical protein TKO01_04190 [Tetragenococcus koreensis]